MTPYFLALASATCFALASLIFTEFARKISPVWINAFKALVAWIAFGVAVAFFTGWMPITPVALGALFLSGILGLAIGDIFLLTAYARMGSARTLVLFGFQPFFLGVAAHFLLGQEISWVKATAVVFFAACLFIFSLEKFHEAGHWEIYGLVAALIGVLFDNSGVLLTRWAFDTTPGLDAFQANLVRCSGAVAFFFLFGNVRKFNLVAGFKSLSFKDRGLALGSAFLGTFMSLALYVTAMKTGNLAAISAVGVSGPLLSSAFECFYYKKWPSTYLLVALVFFVIGFAILSFG